MNQAFICDAVRTPFGRFGGALSSMRADDLAALPLKALLERNPGLDPALIDDVIYGCANQAGEDNRNVARMAAGERAREHHQPPVRFQPRCDRRRGAGD